MHGNVWEWCLDQARDYNGWVYSNNYTARKRTDPLGTEGYERLIRGGSWINDGGKLRSAYRMCASPSIVGNGVGFRVALVPVR